MRTMTIGDIRRGETSGVPLSRVYVIRDGDEVLYVGKSKNAITRVESHLGIGQWGWRNCGTVLSEHLRTATSDSFTVELFDSRDVKSAMNLTDTDRLFPGELDSYVSDLEMDLINKLSPKFNRIGN